MDPAPTIFPCKGNKEPLKTATGIRENGILKIITLYEDLF